MKAGRQDVTTLHARRGLDHTLTVNADAAVLDQLRGKAAGFHKPRIPQPLIEALLLRCVQMLVLCLKLLLEPFLKLAEGCERQIGVYATGCTLRRGARSDRLLAVRALGPRVAVAIVRAFTASLLLRLVLLMAADWLLLGALGFCGRIRFALRRGLACAVAIAIAILGLMIVPVVVPVMPVPAFPIAGCRLIVRPLSLLRLPLLAGRPSARCWPAVLMRPVPALTITLASAWAAVMTPFALALRALKFRLRSAETPDFFEFRLSTLGRRAICRFWG